MAYNTDKKRVALELDPTIVKELVFLLNKAGWEMILDPLYLIWKCQERRLMYSRRSGFLQIYWNGFGHQTIQTSLSDWTTAKDIVEWTSLLNNIELIELKHEDEEDENDLEASETLALIDSIFL
jgi:hypothetical protein